MEEQNDGRVRIGSVAVNGWIDVQNRCPACGGGSVFDFDYDARFCPVSPGWKAPAMTQRAGFVRSAHFGH